MFSWRRFLLYFLLCALPLAAQLTNNAVTVSALANAASQPDEVVFSVVVASGLDQSLDGILAGVSSLGLTAANLVNVNTANLPVNEIVQTDSTQEQWTFQLTVPFSKMKDTTAALASLQQSIGKSNAGLSLTYSVTGSQVSQSPNCNLGDLVAQARAEAQQIASAASLKAGAIIGLTNFAGGCGLTASFALGPIQGGPNTITVTATRTNSITTDQAFLILTVTSGLTATLDDVTGALSGAGVTGLTFSGVRTLAAPQPTLHQTVLTWTFTETAPLAMLKDTLAQLAAARRTITNLGTGLSLTFTVQGVSSSQPGACSEADLFADAKAQGQKLAAAAGVSVGGLLIMSVASATIVWPNFEAPACSLTGQFQLL